MDLTQLFSYDFSPLVLGLASAAFAAVMLLTIFWLCVLSKVRHAATDSDDLGDLPDEEYPDVSVVVYAHNHGNYIEHLINDIFAQDYPGALEVIVVNDGSFDGTEDIVGRLELTRSNLYLTYTPGNSRNLSRRKLSITLGIKAARYPVVVLTHGNCRIHSPLWLRRMCRHFAEGKEIVAGYSYPKIKKKEQGARRVRSFDRVYQAVSWIYPSLLGRRLHMADGRNLAYLRRLFFDNKGFSRSLNLNFGDDDIFVSEISTRDNSVVEISQESMVEFNTPTPRKTHIFEKLSRKFTSRYVNSTFRSFMDTACLFWWVFLGCGIAASILALPSILLTVVFAVVLLAIWITLAVCWKRTSKSLHSRAVLLTMLPLMVWHPVYELIYSIRCMKTRKKNFTWTN